MARWSHLVPSRTQKLSTAVAKVSPWERIARRRAFFFLPPFASSFRSFMPYNCPMKFGLVKLRSALSAEDTDLEAESKAFLSSINPKKEYGFVKARKDLFNLFYVQTGGSEIYFKDLYERYPEPYYLLVTGTRNSLAASLEILSFLHQQGKQGKILQGSPEQIAIELSALSKAISAKERFASARFARIGVPSDWLIASSVEKKALKKRFGATLIDIPTSTLNEWIDAHRLDNEKDYEALKGKTRRKSDLRESFYIDSALRFLVSNNRLDGFTLRCFDLLQTYQQTSCISFGLLNRDGIIAGCEGDVPAMLTMYLAKALTGQSSFMANPARIDVEKKEAVYAHCTCPLDMLSSFALTTHFESGLGFGIKGEFFLGPITCVKFSSDLSKLRVLRGEIIDNLSESTLCRSQIVVRFSDPIDGVLEDPFGNHMIFLYGDHAKEFEAFKALCHLR